MTSRDRAMRQNIPKYSFGIRSLLNDCIHKQWNTRYVKTTVIHVWLFNKEGFENGA